MYWFQSPTSLATNTLVAATQGQICLPCADIALIVISEWALQHSNASLHRAQLCVWLCVLRVSHRTKRAASTGSRASAWQPLTSTSTSPTEASSCQPLVSLRLILLLNRCCRKRSLTGLWWRCRRGRLCWAAATYTASLSSSHSSSRSSNSKAAADGLQRLGCGDVERLPPQYSAFEQPALLCAGFRGRKLELFSWGDGLETGEGPDSRSC